MPRFRCFLALMAVVLLTGCGFKDLDKRFFVLGVGIDRTGSESTPFKVTLKLGIPSSKIEPGNSKYQIISQESNTIAEAVRLLKSKIDKELDFGHAKIVLIGESLARSGVREPLDWFFRRRDIQSIAYFAVSAPSAESVLALSPKSERLPANALFLTFDQEGTESSYIITEYLFDFYRRLNEPGLDPYMPIIEPLNEETYMINRIALFDKERMVGTLNPGETRVLNELMRGFDKVDINTNSNDFEFVLAVDRFKAGYRIVARPDGKPRIDYRVSMTGIAEESKKPLYHTDWEKAEQAVAAGISRRIVLLLTKLQKLHVDPIGFGLRYRAMHSQPNAWEEWNALYPELEFRANVAVKLKGTGVIN
ncbi:Spore germination protein B3 [Paenibacillus solanacearum]|uniref:Spore germination protein B3 n=1 Tax=Paenibacillus solanacearum TaxID=2048548 RepID=A0A916K326_9BACL|nr:Ger(x)C family spore germination protein [Paenibacillus solanacearum]CAG7627702.1 Spore germination protein B3 [Paenibacillus solanacearum]